MSNTPVATNYTYAFVRSALPASAQVLLEVGCGDGELAGRLLADGFDVVAVDADPTCVEAAKARGVDARQAEWPAAPSGQFDAILFTRSLHHVDALDASVEAAIRSLRPEGRVIVEDFRAEGGSARSSEWYLSMVRELSDGGTLINDADAGELVGKLAPARHDGHQLHSSKAIAAALERHFAVRTAGAAYYFRYLEPFLRDAGAAQWLLDIELERLAAGELDPLGQRFIAWRR